MYSTGLVCGIKKTLRAAEQDQPRIKELREHWPAVIGSIEAKRFIFVDESGVTTEMTRRYGRVIGGQRVNDSAPANWRTLTLLGAVGLTGWVASMTVEAPTDADVFLAFLDHVLCPKLEPGQVVVMDNLTAHKVAGVSERILATGADVLYLPPYSPEFNPIEKCWAQAKQYLRAAKARTIPDLEQAISAALDELTPNQAAAYFQHCGYQT